MFEAKLIGDIVRRDIWIGNHGMCCFSVGIILKSSRFITFQWYLAKLHYELQLELIFVYHLGPATSILLNSCLLGY